MYEQLSLPMNLNPTNYVVQANKLITGKQTLTVNEAKLLRLAIMQIVKEDSEIKPYIVKITDLAELLNIDSSNLYRDVDRLTDGVMKAFVKIKKDNSISYEKFSWVDTCKYNDGAGTLEIRLNPSLGPFLVGLQKYYTQYPLENILAMNSFYAIRIYELLQQAIKTKIIPKEGTSVKLSLEEIRAACECEKKFTQFGMFKKKVIDIAKREIERVTVHTIDYTYIKSGRKVIGLDFLVNVKYH